MVLNFGCCESCDIWSSTKSCDLITYSRLGSQEYDLKPVRLAVAIVYGVALFMKPFDPNLIIQNVEKKGRMK